MTNNHPETWTPLERGVLTYSKSVAELDPSILDDAVYINDIYQVFYREIGSDPKIVHLSIKRRDKTPCRDWRHFQAIKNQLCGPESCALEFYPPESKLVDSANQYHLWVFESGDYFPFMFQTRVVSESEELGNKQRPLKSP